MYQKSFFLLLLLVCAGARAEPWTPQLRTRAGIRDFLMALSVAQPKLVESLAGRGANLVEIAETAPAVLDFLGEDAQPIRIEHALVTSLESAPAGVAVYESQEALAKSIAELQAAVIELPTFELTNLVADVAGLHSAKANGKPFFILLPLLYEADGKPRVASTYAEGKAWLSKEVAELTPAKVRALYFRSEVEKYYDGYPGSAVYFLYDTARRYYSLNDSRWPTLTLGHSLPTAFKVLRERSHYYRGPGQLAGFDLFAAETLPGIVALYRSFFAHDCATNRTAYYSLVKGVHTLNLKLNHRAKSDFTSKGYSVVLETTYDGKKIPYVLILNGAGLSEESTQKVLRLVSEQFGSETVAIADYGHPSRERLTDNESVRSFLKELPSVPVQLELPAGWKKLDGWLAERGGEGLELMREENIRHARLVHVPTVLEGKLSLSPAGVRTDRLRSPYRELPRDWWMEATDFRAARLLGSQAHWRGWTEAEATSHFFVRASDLIPVSTTCRKVEEVLGDDAP